MKKIIVAVLASFAALGASYAEDATPCAHTSTCENVSWTFPADATNVPGSNVPGIVIADEGIFQDLYFGGTNAVVASMLAELPDGVKGEIAGCHVYRASNSENFYAFAYSNGDGTFSLGHGTTTDSATSVAGAVADWTAPHVWTFAFAAQTGARLYCDGVQIASTGSIKWSDTSITGPVTFGDDPRGGWALAGAKIYAVGTDFGVGDAIFTAATAASNNPISQIEALAEFSDEPIATQLEKFALYRDTGYTTGEVTHDCVLRISEIMPKPTDSKTEDGTEKMDLNGLESGWVEVENTSGYWADLADYRFIRVNRGKKTDPAGVGNFPNYLVPPHGRAIFYTSERYSNSKDDTVSAFAEGTFDGKPMIFEDYGNILVWGDKVNPKKSPYVRLYYAPVSNASNIVSVVDTVVVPSDLPEGWSIIVGNAAEGEGTRRWMCPTPTRNAENTATAGLTRIGPNVGPLYEKKGQKKTEYASEFAAPVPPAVPGTDYTVTLPINGVMNPDGTFTPRAADQVQSIKFVYRKDLDDTTLVTNDIDMAAKTTDANWGDQYKATIPSSYFPAAGHLMQWKVLITDGEGVEWTSPSFNNKDDGYEWYGTIVEPDPTTQMSATLPTWHMFASGNHLKQMDVDADKQNKSLVPYNARIAIYDSSTSNYYDYVRIDLRGNTSAKFTKKGHGLRFAKAHPLTMRDVVSGEDIEEIRKTSLISEFADPSFMRQMIAFWLWRRMGNLVPFDFPVRCNLNGEFYQLAFNSERFTDELIEDVYGLDKFGYSYKNVGTMNLATTTAGSIEKKTPDDEDESNISVLTNSLVKPLQLNNANVAHSTSDSASLTKFVVKKFDLPAWLNYLASARITQEMDDVWANVCAYYDNPDMLEGVRGKDTWMPLGYDFNLTFGQYYINDLDSNALAGLSATNDWYKSHPLYGGWTILARKSPSGSLMNGNNGFEAIYQSAKFRRLYLRRLRTLMDQELKEPGTPEGEVPFMVKMREMANLMQADATLDLDKWKDDTTDNAIDVWKNTTRPADMDAGIDDIWENYVVPRREHLYVTHSVTNTAKVVGYGSNLNAGIPLAQSPIATLAPNITLDISGHADGYVVISNDNAEAVDMSGWSLSQAVVFTFPAGTVCDAHDVIYIVSDRRTYIEAHDAELTDQVIVGNATFDGSTTTMRLSDANGVEVAKYAEPSNESNFLRILAWDGIPPDDDYGTDEWIVLTNISDTVTLNLAGVSVKVGKDTVSPKCSITLESGTLTPGGTIRLDSSDFGIAKGWEKITDGAIYLQIADANGTIGHNSGSIAQKNFTGYPNGRYYLQLTSFEEHFEQADVEMVPYPTIPVAPGESEPLAATTLEEAQAALAGYSIALTQEDVSAGLATDSLTLVAAAVGGGYAAVVEVRPELRPVEDDEADEPVSTVTDADGTVFSVKIKNAAKGVWYGFEVADNPSEELFADDIPSFSRATADGSATVSASKRAASSGFYRVKASAAKPAAE